MSEVAVIQLLNPPLAVEASLPPTLFGDRQIRINNHDYAVASVAGEQGELAERVELLRGEKKYTLLVTVAGLHSCTCEDFQYGSGRERRPCKRLAGAYITGLMTRFPPPGCSQAVGDESK